MIFIITGTCMVYLILKFDQMRLGSFYLRGWKQLFCLVTIQYCNIAYGFRANLVAIIEMLDKNVINVAVNRMTFLANYLYEFLIR